MKIQEVLEGRNRPADIPDSIDLLDDEVNGVPEVTLKNTSKGIVMFGYDVVGLFSSKDGDEAEGTYNFEYNINTGTLNLDYGEDDLRHGWYFESDLAEQEIKDWALEIEETYGDTWEQIVVSQHRSRLKGPKDYRDIVIKMADKLLPLKSVIYRRVATKLKRAGGNPSDFLKRADSLNWNYIVRTAIDKKFSNNTDFNITDLEQAMDYIINSLYEKEAVGLEDIPY